MTDTFWEPNFFELETTEDDAVGDISINLPSEYESAHLMCSQEVGAQFRDSVCFKLTAKQFRDLGNACLQVANAIDKI